MYVDLLFDRYFRLKHWCFFHLINLLKNTKLLGFGFLYDCEETRYYYSIGFRIFACMWRNKVLTKFYGNNRTMARNPHNASVLFALFLFLEYNHGLKTLENSRIITWSIFYLNYQRKGNKISAVQVKIYLPITAIVRPLNRSIIMCNSLHLKI